MTGAPLLSFTLKNSGKAKYQIKSKTMASWSWESLDRRCTSTASSTWTNDNRIKRFSYSANALPSTASVICHDSGEGLQKPKPNRSMGMKEKQECPLYGVLSELPHTHTKAIHAFWSIIPTLKILLLICLLPQVQKNAKKINKWWPSKAANLSG